jgi:hypothetical protein
MKGSTIRKRSAAQPAFIVGRAAFEKVAAVEGLQLSPASQALFRGFDARGASPVERLVTVLTANSSPKAVHVVPHPKGWAVRASRARRATVVYTTLEEAVAHAKKSAQARRGELLLHAEDGRLVRRAASESL